MKYAHFPIKRSVTSSNQFQLHSSFVPYVSFVGGDIVDKAKLCWYLDEGDHSKQKVVIADDDFERPGFKPVASRAISGIEPDEINQSEHDNPRVTIPKELEGEWYSGAIKCLSDIDEVFLIGIPQIDQDKNSCVVVEPINHDNNLIDSEGLLRVKSEIPDDHQERILTVSRYEMYL